MATTVSSGPTPTPGKGAGIDARLGAATTMAPATHMEDSHPQAILKLYGSTSWDYIAHHKLPVSPLGHFTMLKIIKHKKF